MTESLFPLLATVVQDSTRLADVMQYSLNLLHPCIDPASPAMTSLTVRLEFNPESKTLHILLSANHKKQKSPLPEKPPCEEGPWVSGD